MKKRTIINIIILVVFITGVFFIVKFDAMGKLYERMKQQATQNKTTKKENTKREFIYETILDNDGKEIVLKLEKLIGEDENGNKVVVYSDTNNEGIVIYQNGYKGKITGIEDNKIYFEVDLELIEGTSAGYVNVKNYELVFDIDTYDLESNKNVGYSVNDDLTYDYKMYFSAGGLRVFIGKNVRLQDVCFKDSHIDEEYKSLVFYIN